MSLQRHDAVKRDIEAILRGFELRCGPWMVLLMSLDFRITKPSSVETGEALNDRLGTKIDRLFIFRGHVT